MFKTTIVNSVKTIRVTLSSADILLLVRQHVYSLMGQDDPDVYDKDVTSIDMGGIEFDELTAQLQIMTHVSAD